MKYIRTKEGHIYKRLFIDRAIINGVCDENLNPVGETIIKESDNLEELCDEFVLVREDIHDFLISGDIPVYIEGWDMFGAIWTDKGLIYVAKMNEKKEWELL